MKEEFKVKKREHDEILKLLERKGVVPDKEFIEQSIVTVPGEQQNLFEDFYRILQEFNDDKNIFKLSTMNQKDVFADSLLGALGNVPDYPPYLNIDGSKNPDYIKPRYRFLKDFRNAWHTNLSAVEGNKLNKFTEIAGAFMQYKTMMDMQIARGGGMGDEQGPQGAQGKTNRIKNLFRKKG